MQRTGVMVLLVLACGPAGPAGPGEMTTTSGGGTTEGTTEGSTPTVTSENPDPPGSSSSGGTTAVGTSGAATTEGGTFLPLPDVIDDIECDSFAQDCPEGQKCVPYANDGGNSWNALKCVEVMEGAVGVGEECFVVGDGVSGIDNCAAGSYCWGPEEDNQGGECLAFCTGSVEAPKCEPGFTCPISSDGVINLCFPLCDPLEQDCAADEVCIFASTGDGFLCVFDASMEEGQLHDVCEFANACDPGLVCMNPTAAVECDQRQNGCCEPYCDHTLADQCPGEGQECQPWWPPGEAPPGLEKVGACAVPE